MLIDLPGLRDTREMDAVALDMAMEADLILWVFRSEPAFSEQDAEFLSILVSTCGPHVVRLLINVICPNDDKIVWRAFTQHKLQAHRASLSRHIKDIGLSEKHVETLCVLNARLLRRSWFLSGFGGRELFRLLQSASRKSDEQVKRARYVRVKSAFETCGQWLAYEREEVEREFQRTKAVRDEYERRVARREKIKSEI